MSILHRILHRDIDVAYDISQCLTGGLPVSLSPHEFIQVAWKLVAFTTLHPLQFCFNSIPVVFYCLRMDTGCWVNKVQRVIYNTMTSHRWDGVDRIVNSPLVRMNNCAGSSV